MNIQDITNIYVGNAPADAIYIGTAKVWPPVTPTPTPSIVANMTHVDVSTFLAANNASTEFNVTDAWANLISPDTIYAGTTATYEIDVGGDHYHLRVNNGMYDFCNNSLLKFSGHTFTKIIFKTTAGSQYQNKSLSCSSGNIQYDSNEDAYIWTGNSSTPIIRNTSGVIRFYDLYYE